MQLAIKYRLARLVFGPLCAVLAFAGIAGAAEAPTLRFDKIIGDLRGRSIDNLSVSIAGDGSVCLLMRSGRVAVFDNRGKYQRSLEATLSWPQDFIYLSAVGKRLLLGDYKKDFSWVYSDRRHGSQPGAFDNPCMVTEDDEGTGYVSDTGNRRIQIFAPDNTRNPAAILSLIAKPERIAVKNKDLVVATEDGSVVVYGRKGDSFSPRASQRGITGVRSVCFGPGNSVYVAQTDSLKRYAPEKGNESVLQETATLAPSHLELWPNVFLDNVSMVSGPEGAIFFPAPQHGKFLVLDPTKDSIRECGSLPGGALAVGFAAGGTLYAADAAENDGGTRIRAFKWNDSKLSPPGTISKNPLYLDRNVPVWGLLPDNDGGVYIRVLEEGYQKGWPALTIKKVFANGQIKPFLDFGELYGKRTTFHPSAAFYSMKFDSSRNILLAAMPLVAVYNITPDGRILWEAGRQPQGGADKIDFGVPRDVAVDSRGNIWVSDFAKDSILCLSPHGKLLFTYGHHAGVDDIDGKGFDHPSGIQIAKCDDGEFLYVGDSGNQRIVKFRISQ